MSHQLDQLTKSLVDTYSAKLDQQQKMELMDALEILSQDLRYNKFKNMFPDTGEFRRELYPKHVAFFEAGKTYTERGFVAGNRTGKSEAGAFEVTCHATGLYPDWWTGKRFYKPLMIWVGGDTATTCRDIIQFKLLGSIGDFGSGMIPKELIVGEPKNRRNVPEAVETIRIQHVSGGLTTIVFKTYDQGRQAWQGAEVDFCWIDEECPQDVYSEALIRLMTTQGSIILTFTPLSGLTPLVVDFLDNSQETESPFPKFVANVTWADVPHLRTEDIEKMLASTPPALRDARSKGIPTVGSGLIYPLPIETAQVEDFKIPKHYMKAYGFDVGWNNTAAVWGAWDRDNDVIYIYSEHKQGQLDPILHGAAIKARGAWIKGCIDPGSRASSQKDGEKLFELYTKRTELGGAGLHLRLAANAVEAGLFTVWDRLNTGRLKFFKSCSQLSREFNLYHRDKNGAIVKTNDHLLDALRYLCMAESSLWSYQQQEQTGKKIINIADYAMSACN